MERKNLNLSGTGQVTAQSEYIGCSGGVGIFNQAGGTNSATNIMVGLGAEGTYAISGWTLKARELEAGSGGTGHFEIKSPDASITVSKKLSFGVDSTFAAVDGSTIHMDGASFDNYNTDAADLSGLNNLELIFEGGIGAGIGTFEVAGLDIGAEMSGFDEKFALDALILDGVDIGQVQLVDFQDNMPGTEALYIKDFVLGNGSFIDLNGLNLYYLNFADYGGTIVGGEPIYVPEPATVFLLGLGGLTLLKRSKVKN